MCMLKWCAFFQIYIIIPIFYDIFTVYGMKSYIFEVKNTDFKFFLRLYQIFALHLRLSLQERDV